MKERGERNDEKKKRKCKRKEVATEERRRRRGSKQNNLFFVDVIPSSTQAQCGRKIREKESKRKKKIVDKYHVALSLCRLETMVRTGRKMRGRKGEGENNTKENINR